jgi:hypothetical protein
MRVFKGIRQANPSNRPGDYMGSPDGYNGFAFYFVVGKHANLTTQNSTSAPCFNAVRLTPPR